MLRLAIIILLGTVGAFGIIGLFLTYNDLWAWI